MAANTDLRRHARDSALLARWIGVSGAIAYLVLLNVPLLDSRFNVLTAHPEDYATGSFGLAVNASYLALATALTGLAVSLLPVRGWSIAALGTLIPPVLLCLALAVDPIGVARANQLVLLPIISLALAPATAALTLRHRFGAFALATTALAVAVLVAFIALVVVGDDLGGLVNRVFNTFVGLWTAVASFSLRRQPNA